MIKYLASKYVLSAAAVLLVLAGVWGYGQYQYRQGVADTKADAVLQTIAIEQGMQYERDRADAEYRGAVLAREAALADLSDVRGRLDRVLADARHAKATGASGRPDGAGEIDWIGLVASCAAEYEFVGGEAGRLSDKVTGLQGYVKAILQR